MISGSDEGESARFLEKGGVWLRFERFTVLLLALSTRRLLRARSDSLSCGCALREPALSPLRRLGRVES